MFIFKINKSLFYLALLSMLVLFFSCSSNPEINLKKARRNIEVLDSKLDKTNNVAMKNYFEAKKLYKQGLIFYNNDKWDKANERFIKSIKKSEESENLSITY